MGIAVKGCNDINVLYPFWYLVCILLGKDGVWDDLQFGKPILYAPDLFFNHEAQSANQYSQIFFLHGVFLLSEILCIILQKLKIGC